MAEIIKEDFSKQKCGVCHKRFATKWCDYVIQQYQMSAIVLSIIYGVLFLALTGLLAWGAIELIKKYKEDPYYDYEVILMLGCFVGIPLEVASLVATSINIVHACAPIASLITSITN